MIWLIIPAFNEATSLSSLLPLIPRTIEGHRVNTLVVSDGSTDATVSVAVSLGFPVLAMKRNCGKGSAVRAALETISKGTSAAVVVMDGDGQHLPQDLPRLVRPLLLGRADAVLASRYLTDPSRGATPLNRYLVRSATVLLLGRLLGRRFSDPYCGYRAFTGAVIEEISVCGERYEGELESLFDLCRFGLRTVEIPIERIYGPGTSKMSADGGRFIGRIRAVSQYAATIWRKHHESVEVAGIRVGAREAA